MKRRSNLKYDPDKAIKDDKEKRDKIVFISDLISDNYINNESVTVDDQAPISAAVLKLGDLIEREKQRKLVKQNISVKGIIGSTKTVIDKEKVSVSESFQKLDYLKNVPKKIDCWLSKEKNTSTEIKHKGYTDSKHSNSMHKFRRCSQDLDKHSAINHSMNNLDDFATFTMHSGLVKRKVFNMPTSTKNVPKITRDFNHVSRLNDSDISAESFGLNTKKLQFRRRSAFSPKDKNTKNLGESLFGNEGECLEYLIDRLEGGSSKGLISPDDKILLREDKSMYLRLKKSKPLLDIFKLMNNVERDNNKNEDNKSKFNRDFEFEKLLIKLKNEYRELYEEKSKLNTDR